MDLPHLRNALARLPQSKLPDNLKAKARAHLIRHAKALGVGNYDEEERDMAEEAKEEIKKLQDSIAQKDKEIADLQSKLEAKEKEYNDLKEKHDKVEKELKALKDQIREALVKELKDAYPGEDGNPIFSDEEIQEMSDAEIRRLLKARTGRDYAPVVKVLEQGADKEEKKKNQPDDTGWTVGVPGVAGWEE